MKAENLQDENLGEVEKEVKNVGNVGNVGKTEPQSPVPLGWQLSEQEFVIKAQHLCKESEEGRKTPSPTSSRFMNFKPGM